MRVTKTNAADTFRVKAYAGATGVLLAMDLARCRRSGLLGFAIEKRKKGTSSWSWLLSSLTFPGLDHTLPQWNATPSNLAPIQKFRWADYSVDSGVTYSYRVHLVRGTPAAPTLEESLSVDVTTDTGAASGQEVRFNRAVAASQAFGRKFPDLDALLSKNKQLPIEKWPEAPRNWLQRGLLDLILKFIACAKDGRWALDVAIYEYELAAITSAVVAAHRRGVKVRVLYHAKASDQQTEINEGNLARIPKAKKKGRVTSKIFHDKFIVLSKVKANGDLTPVSVLCGSTNFTENGVYRQANVVHVVDTTSVAKQYATLFEEIWATPDDVGATREWITTNNEIDPASKYFVGFSPRSGKTDLDEFARIIAAADRDVLFATAFALYEPILDALLGGANDDVVRFGIQNTKSRITGFHADRTAEFTAVAFLNNGLEGWVKEGLRQQRGNLSIHLKAVVANFTSDDPTIISGSHNLSVSASNGNDENYLIIRGDTNLADRYGLEILRFYEHYRFRYYAKLLALKKVKPLSPDDSWTEPYYQDGNVKALARVRFVGR